MTRVTNEEAIRNMRLFQAYRAQHLERLMAGHRFINGGDASYAVWSIQNGPNNCDYFLAKYWRGEAVFLDLASTAATYKLAGWGRNYDFLNMERSEFIFRIDGGMTKKGEEDGNLGDVEVVGYYDIVNRVGFVLMPKSVVWKFEPVGD